MKRLIWTALVAAGTAAAAALAVRGLRYLWMRIEKEPPPEQPWWARRFVGSPLGRGVAKGIEPT
jgi:hypothetical protein